MKSAWRPACALAALATAGLMVGYSMATPAFEAPDEPGHFRYVQSLARGGGLPVQGRAGDLDPERSQPPLYYAVQAGLAKLIPADGAPVPDFDHHNPYQNATLQGNVNLYSHPPREDFPWTGQVLQLHAMRLLNLAFAALALLSTFGIARQTGLSRWFALASAATLGLLPQFDFIAGALNADNAITATSAASLYLLLRWLRAPDPRLAVLLGLAVGAAMLSKLSGLAVLAVVLAAMLWLAWRQRALRAAGQAALAPPVEGLPGDVEQPRDFARSQHAARGAALAGGVALACGGWWYVRNLALYGDILGWQPMLSAIGAMLRPRPLGPFEAAASLLQNRATAVGVFGWNNLRLADGVYLAADVVAAAALAGLIWRAVAALRWRAKLGQLRAAAPVRLADLGEGTFLVVLILWVAVFAASLVRWVEVNTDAAQWRLLFPAFPGLVVLLTLGLSRLSRFLAAALPVAIAGLSLAALGLVIRPAYAAQPPYTGPIQHEVHARFGDSLELVGYDDPRPRNPKPGQPIALSLYWRGLQPLDRDDIVDLVALNVDARSGLKENTWPDYGRMPTSRWRPGEVVVDRHLLPNAGSLAPGVWSLLLDVFQPLEGAPRLPLAGGGTTFNVGRFLVPPPQAAVITPEAAFQGNLELVEHAVVVRDGRLSVVLAWRAAGPVGRDYTVFVHLLDSAGKLVGQSDGQPGGGRFPTSLLPAGATVHDDVHLLDVSTLAPGDYQLEVGLYDAQTGVRLNVSGSPSEAVMWPLTLGG